MSELQEKGRTSADRDRNRNRNRKGERKPILQAVVLSLALGLVLGAAFGWGLFAIGSREGAQGGAVGEATVVLNAFHWGWVPEVLDPGPAPGVRAEIAPGAQGSQIIVPLGTKLTLVLRNAAGNPELHERYESRFAPYFEAKYKDAWEMAHDAAHDELPSPEKAEGAHGTGEEGAEPAADAGSSVLDHSFFLEGYNLEVIIPHEPEGNVKVLKFVADRPGEFRFLCTNFCGVGHADMTGTLVVR